MGIKTEYKVLDRPKDARARQIGYGNVLKVGPKGSGKSGASGLAKDREGFGALCDWIKGSVACPIWNLPVIEQVRITLNGPTDDATVKRVFGSKIDIFGLDTDATGIDYVETTMAQKGELQCNSVVCAVGFQIEIAPWFWTQLGLALTAHPSTVTMPPIPDSLTKNDIINGGLGTAFGSGGSLGADTVGLAILEYGWWAGAAAWHMVRGYDYRWMYGRHTNIMDDVLRHTAFLPTNGQNGSSSSSLQDTVYEVAQTNARYRDFGTGLIFAPNNRVRTGSTSSFSGDTGNVAVMRPSRAYDLVPATYGGTGLRELLGSNSEFRKLTVPYLMKGGVPIGLFCQECDNDQGEQMRNFLSITYGAGNGVIPPEITPDAQYALGTFDGTGAQPVGQEITLDTTPLAVAQQMYVGRKLYKMGPFKVTQAVKGWEVPDDTYTAICQDSDLRDAIMAECDVRFAKAA